VIESLHSKVIFFFENCMIKRANFHACLLHMVWIYLFSFLLADVLAIRMVRGGSLPRNDYARSNPSAPCLALKVDASLIRVYSELRLL
jgi:hypothetical protein